MERGEGEGEAETFWRFCLLKLLTIALQALSDVARHCCLAVSDAASCQCSASLAGTRNALQFIPLPRTKVASKANKTRSKATAAGGKEGLQGGVEAGGGGGVKREQR